jgi:hypothetical protein
MNTPFRTLGEIEHSLLNDPPRRRFIIPNVLPAGPSLLFGPSDDVLHGRQPESRMTSAFAALLKMRDFAHQ